MWSLLDLLPDGEFINVLDVGAAFIERPPYEPLVEAGRARVVGFEPNEEACEALNQAYGDTHRFYPFFLADGKPSIFYETNWPITGSLYEPNTLLLEKFQNLSELVTPVASHRVETKRLDDLEGIPEIDFFKIDVQGAELIVFQNGLRVLADSLLIQVEVEFVELYKQQPLFCDVDSFLRRRGFQFHSFNGLAGRMFKPLSYGDDINQPLRQYLWSDALYVADWMDLGGLCDLRLRKYAVLAHDILQSFDLAHLILEEIDRRSGENNAEVYRFLLGDSSLTAR